MRYLALCCIVKDEDRLLKEWLCYHALLGVEHFFLYDNMSKTPVASLLGDFIAEKQVTVRRLHGQAMQKTAYNNALQEFGPQCHWLGFIDVDEFVCPKKDNDLRALLAEFEDYGGLGIAWDIFSANGHTERPSGLVTENYTRCFTAQEMSREEHIKSFVQPARVKENLNPHAFSYQPGFFCVNEDHIPIPRYSHRTFSLRRKVALNHYYYRSQEDYAEKISRGRADTGKSAEQAGGRKMQDFFAHLARETREETSILRFVPALKKALAAKTLPGQPEYLKTGLELYQYTDLATKLLEAGQREKAFLCLCQAIPAYGGQTELWTILALLSRLDKRLDRAELFLRKALSLEEAPHAYKELAALRLAQNRRGEAELLELFINSLPKIPE